MKSWLHTLLDALLLRGTTLARIADRPDAFLQGLIVLLAVALFAGLPTLVQDVIGGFRPPAVVEPGEVQPNVTGSLDVIRPWLRDAGLPEATIDQLVQMAEGNASMAGQVAAQINQLPTALPRPLAKAFIGIGRWLSRPFANSPLPLAAAAMGTWLGYGLWVMLAAKFLGGRGTLHGFFGATAFFAVPHVLDIFGGVPVLGPVLAGIATLWGLVIYAVATGASQHLPAGRAIVAVFAPVVLLFTFVALALLAILAWGLVVSVGGSR